MTRNDLAIDRPGAMERAPGRAPSAVGARSIAPSTQPRTASEIDDASTPAQDNGATPTEIAKPAFAIVIPCLNEEAAIGDLIREILDAANRVDLPASLQSLIVVDNGSTDRTSEVARSAGATVVFEPRRGYGRACLSGVLAADGIDLIVLMDGDRSDTPSELARLLEPLLAGEADLVVGSRTLGSAEPGSLLPQQHAGNWIAAKLLRLLYGVRVTDVGPFRAIRRRDVLAIGMQEMTYGWSVEMLARGARAGLRIQEVPVTWRNRAAGKSKVSGSVRASVQAGYRIIVTILRARL